jgi:hypothetical protein
MEVGYLTKVTIAESDPVDDQAPCPELKKRTSWGMRAGSFFVVEGA